MPHVRVLRPFNNGTHHAFVRPGDVLMVSDERAADLMRNSLVEPFAEMKAAPVPENKAAPLPANKNEADPPVRRGPGRPPKVR
ncbi:hypothetical protein Q8W71_06875 [Methylobacterium sp. NEAU 140]|uniref:hypothetical protein n=1 Tax=Methylobacterium sp. NEAU 140 TaxID=3064945 RepID=UPI002733F1CD|nr:hypothetical protein [Methylobacterium sp. NEAU 140]MDP4022340.1 hypothetical protein [Methylobacterium sp. NEAU 140]